MKNIFDEEYELVKSEFNLDEIIEFSKLHDVQIIRGGDWQYGVYIDGKCYYNALTSIGALWFGINTYNKFKQQ